MFAVMPDAQVVEWIREKYTAIASDLDERAHRRWGAAEARSLGWGGIQAVAAATGLSDRTIRTGIKELDDPNAPPATQQRRSGSGRKRRKCEQPQLVESLQQLVDSGTRGDPRSPLRWTCKSTRTLAEELLRQGFSVSANTVRAIASKRLSIIGCSVVGDKVSAKDSPGTRPFHGGESACRSLWGPRTLSQPTGLPNRGCSVFDESWMARPSGQFGGRKVGLSGLGAHSEREHWANAPVAGPQVRYAAGR